MINEQENKTSLNKMSDLEYTKNDTEMMRYRVNGLSYKLSLSAMVCSILGAFICLNSANPKDFWTIVIILMNVVILLGGFLASERVKNYSKKSSISLFVFGGVCLGRIFWVPLLLMINYNIWTKDPTSAKGTKAGNYLAKTITSKGTSGYAVAFLPSDGNLRAIMAMIFFAAAGVCFIVAGVIGVKRSVKLSNYLESINEKK